MTAEHDEGKICAYIDGELPDGERRAVEAHLASCEACAGLAEDLRMIRQRLAMAGPVPMPATLEARVRSALRQEADLRQDGPAAGGGAPASGWRHYGRMAAALVVTAALSSLATRQFEIGKAGPELVRHDLMTAHLRALTQEGGIQVASSDAHTVRPWFAGKVDFAPEAPNLAGDGFTLVGGRLDIVDGRRVGALVYKRRLHLIDVFAWPDGAAHAPAGQTLRGYNFLNWTKGGITYWAVSDLELDELKRLAELL